MKKLRLMPIILLLVCMLVITMSAISCKTTTKETAAGESAKKQYTIGVSMYSQATAYWQATVEALKKTAADLGNVTLNFLVSEDDANLQNQQIETFISQKVDAIIFVPKDPTAILTAVKKANDAKIPILYLDQAAKSSADAIVNYGVGTDNLALVKTGAQWFVDTIIKPNNLKIKALQFMGALGDANGQLRSQGYNDTAAANSDIFTIVQSIPTEWKWEKAYTGTKDAFVANPDINAILFASDGFWPATSNALKEINKYAKTGEANHIYIVSVDGEPYGVKAVEDHYIDAISCQPNQEAAKQAILAAIKLADGGKMDAEFIGLPGMLLTQENFAENGPKAYGYKDRDTSKGPGQ